ncbi:hypothetical protein Peur_015891 [Populus x canadensis]
MFRRAQLGIMWALGWLGTETAMKLMSCLLLVAHQDIEGNLTVTQRWNATWSSYEVNSRGLEFFSKSWLPGNSHPKALVCCCHSNGDTCTFLFEAMEVSTGVARKVASSGYGVFAMDYPGFGLSDGLHGHFPSLDKPVNDVAEHYSNIKRTLSSVIPQATCLDSLWVEQKYPLELHFVGDSHFHLS